MSSIILAAAIWLAFLVPAGAQDFSALAHVVPEASSVADRGRRIELTLGLSQPVPYRVRMLAEPARAVIDFREVDWRGLTLGNLSSSRHVTTLQAGKIRAGWSRLVLELDRPFALESADLRQDRENGIARLKVTLAPAGGTAAATATHFAQDVLWGLPEPRDISAPRRRQDGSRPLRVVLDPGHGGIDPGAERGGVAEADLMLQFARELQEVLRRSGMEAVLTRNADVFVPLEARISAARAAQADVFLSFHADVLAEGRASGATIYTLSEKASEAAAQILAERHDRADLLSGVDLGDQDDEIAGVLMDLARVETAPRSEALAEALVSALRQGIGKMHRRPHQSAGFSVLKAPDIPSVLVELGFLSSSRDLKNLTDPVWRAIAAEAIRDALAEWSQSDAAAAELLRR